MCFNHRQPWETIKELLKRNSVLKLHHYFVNPLKMNSKTSFTCALYNIMLRCGMNPIQEKSYAMFHLCPRLFGRDSIDRSQKKSGPYTHEMRTNVIRRLATQQNVAQHKHIPHLVPSQSKVTAISGSPTDVL